jgi:hypothetical protein
MFAIPCRTTKTRPYGSRFWDAEKDADMRLVFQAIDDGEADTVRSCAIDGLGRKVSEATNFTPLMYAARCRDAVLVEILAPYSQAEGLAQYTLNALLIAISQEHAGCVKALIPLSDLQAQDALLGRTPLMHAAAAGHAECVELLLSGSDLNAVDCNGRNAAKLARHSGHGDIEDQIASFESRMEREALALEARDLVSGAPSRNGPRL